MSESIEYKPEHDNSKSDFMEVGGNIFTNVPYKLTFFMFFIGMLLFSDLFINNVLSGIPDTVDGECPTSKGTIIQLLLYCLSLIICDLMIKYKWI